MTSSYDDIDDDLAPSKPIEAGAEAHSYLRFSEKRQSRGDSRRRQLEETREFAAKHGLRLQDKSYEDLGLSAFDGTNVKKGALKTFIDAVASGAVRRGAYLLVENLDRVSRASAMDAVVLLHSLVSAGIRVVTMTDKQVFDEDSIQEPGAINIAVGTFIRANDESKQKSKRVKKAHIAARKERKPFGGHVGWVAPVRDEQSGRTTGWKLDRPRAASVIRVFRLFRQGMGSHAIAKLANDQGWPIPGRATIWHKTLPLKLLRNRRVLGELQPTVVLKGGKRKEIGETWGDYYPKLVSERLFYAANAAVLRREGLPKKRDSDYMNPFQGILKCGNCGGTYSRKGKSGKLPKSGKPMKNKPGYGIYVCANRELKVNGSAECPNWNSDELIETLLPGVMAYVDREVVAGTSQKKASDDLEAARAELAEKKKQKARLIHVTMYEESLRDDKDIAAKLRTLKDEIEGLEVAIANLVTKAAEPISPSLEEHIDTAVDEALHAFLKNLDGGKVERARHHRNLIRHVKEIWVFPRSHAFVQLHDGPEPQLIPFTEDGAVAGGMFALKDKVEKKRRAQLPARSDTGDLHQLAIGENLSH